MTMTTTVVGTTVSLTSGRNSSVGGTRL
jgi:hypothetical protein